MINTIRQLILILSTAFVFVGFAQEKEKSYQIGLIGFYNLENLFDTIDDPTTIDEEFLPKGSYAWTSEKYNNKLLNMSEAISRMGGKIAGQEIRCPIVLGVSEIENSRVLEDLVAMPALKPYNFGVVHYDGPDRRGVDVGLLYQKDKFQLLGSRSVRLYDSVQPHFLTRDQLVVTGIFMGDTIHVIVNHWPSRLGGERRSSPKREMAARLTRSIVDSLFAINPKAKVIVMGDLNDDPINKSVVTYMDAPKITDPANLKPGQMYNASYPIFKEGIGTLCYRDQWNLFDQIIISQNLTGKDRSSLKMLNYRIFNDNMLKQKDGRYNGYPLRTTAGGIYLNGYSDHFPVYLMMIKEK
ncbi:MAG: endonuclease/exonuclease/phosphatase family protein [Bacteroidales bacterium]